MNRLSFVIVLWILAISCNNIGSNRRIASCQYKLKQLVSDSPKVIISYVNDTLVEVRDGRKDSSWGEYIFDSSENLRFYAFLINNSEYKYSEQYDGTGNVIKQEGVPLVEYRLWRKGPDTVRITLYLFSLNKEYNSIEVISNNKDTVSPMYLYRSSFHTNMKCFSFELPVAQTIRDLELYTKGKYINRCTRKEHSFADTISFQGTKL